MSQGNALNIQFAINQLIYANSATSLIGLATAANGVLITSAGSVPSISSTLPAAVQLNITQVGTLVTGVWNASIISPTYGGTGVNNGTSTFTIGGNTSFVGAFTFAGTLTGNTAVTFPTSGTLATTSGASGIVNPGLINQLAYYAAAGSTVSGLTTANNGTLVTSNTGVPSILAGPGTTGQILQSNAAAAPSFSTASYPSTTTINQILYSSAANTVTGLTTANSAVLVTSSGGVPSLSTTLPAGLTITTPNITGVTNASNATAGSVGEVISSVINNAGALSILNATAKDLTSITLTAGDWDVEANITFVGSGQVLTGAIVWCSLTSATLPDSSLYNALVSNAALAQSVGLNSPFLRVNVNTNTTVFLSGQITLGSGTATMRGGIYARRVR